MRACYRHAQHSSHSHYCLRSEVSAPSVLNMTPTWHFTSCRWWPTKSCCQYYFNARSVCKRLHNTTTGPMRDGSVLRSHRHHFAVFWQVELFCNRILRVTNARLASWRFVCRRVLSADEDHRVGFRAGKMDTEIQRDPVSDLLVTGVERELFFVSSRR